MTLQEFKAWFEGYTESLNGPPGEKQWKRICDRVKEINSSMAVPYAQLPPYYRYPMWNGLPQNVASYVHSTTDPNATVIPVNFASLGSADATIDSVMEAFARPLGATAN